MISWIIFASIIIILLILDLGVFNKKDHVIEFRESIILSSFYIAIACFFGLYIYYFRGGDATSEYFTGFLLEKAMSMDNIFVISVIFSFFKVPPLYQHRVLFWGILGVIILRAIMIFLGALLLAEFAWVLLIFAAILIYTGVKTWFMLENDGLEVKDLWIYKYLASHFNVYPKIESNNFIIKKNGKTYITPLLMALVTVEFMDVIFAIDSIPAIFAVTQDTFIVYTSNIFAILGLRALYFLLANITKRFVYVKYSLALILMLIGAKIFVGHFIDIPKLIPLVVTIVLLLMGVVLSVVRNRVK